MKDQDSGAKQKGLVGNQPKRRGRPPGSQNKEAGTPSRRWTRKSAAEESAHDESKRAQLFAAGHRFRHSDGSVKAPLFVVLRALRLRYRTNRELLLAVVTLTDGEHYFDGRPGESVWEVLVRTKLIITAERAWDAANKATRSRWASLATGVDDIPIAD